MPGSRAGESRGLPLTTIGSHPRTNALAQYCKQPYNEYSGITDTQPPAMMTAQTQMLEALAKSIRMSIRTGGCARLQEPFLKSVYAIADKQTSFDSALGSFCEEHGFDVRREGASTVFVFTLP
jgi:hypothetical protein